MLRLVRFKFSDAEMRGKLFSFRYCSFMSYLPACLEVLQDHAFFGQSCSAIAFRVVQSANIYCVQSKQGLDASLASEAMVVFARVGIATDVFPIIMSCGIYWESYSATFS